MFKMRCGIPDAYIQECKRILEGPQDDSTWIATRCRK